MSSKKSYKEDLREVLTSFVFDAISGENYYSSFATVLSVDDTEKTCDVEIIDGAELEGVMLQKVASDDGFFIKPKIGSLVAVSWGDKTTAFVTMFSEVDSIVFQGGGNGGLIIINDLVTKLNELNDKYNDLVQRLLSWTPVTGDGGTALKTLLTTPTPIEQNTAFSADDFENENFKH